MKTIRMVQVFLCAAAAVIPAMSPGNVHAGDNGREAVRVMTFNIRYDNPGDGDDAWPHRKDMAASMIRFHDTDVAGVQEALRGQLDDLASRLPEYAWFGVGRDDGRDAGEFSAIFYRTDRLELLDESTFWLSETPEKPGMGWDAACNRVVTRGKFRDRATGAVFFHFNTHFDHRGETARRESARLLVRRIEAVAGDVPVVVTGDFNARPGSEPIAIITGDGTNTALRLVDSAEISEYPHHGPTGTFSGFREQPKPGDGPIDYVFVKNDVKVVRHGTLSDTFDGRFPSDHLPVLAEVVVGAVR